jgi:serine/threonine protein kinase
VSSSLKSSILTNLLILYNVYSHIVRLLDSVEIKGGAELVFPLFPKSLHDVIQSSRKSTVYPLPLCNRDIRILTKQILESLAFMHDHDVAHFDLKPCKLLIHDTFFGCFVDLTNSVISKYYDGK